MTQQNKSIILTMGNYHITHQQNKVFLDLFAVEKTSENIAIIDFEYLDSAIGFLINLNFEHIVQHYDVKKKDEVCKALNELKNKIDATILNLINQE
ncbi:hypothetical protein QJU93_09855 [Pasteurella skyensis]|uniref:Uncharacterized protein n=1 Tax=Phocoenobacter skyensis TaxID=97481 RepID=A0AAJ6P1I1_9PAST|nr:hypothetical protein [Pasteurella skyensis]MDP8173658.1 hypothetical protein [Pasteurella skyensis]MDP8178026.1 hypothetical protein [Pasteurella skyensis]